MNNQCKQAVQKDFYCLADALAAKEELGKTKAKYYIVNLEVEERPKYKSGRPKGGVRKIKEMPYGLSVTVVKDDQAVSELREEAGCFVMITNVPQKGEDSYDSKAILKAYKDQYGIEQNFGFLKDTVIVNSIFLIEHRNPGPLGQVRDNWLCHKIVII